MGPAILARADVAPFAAKIHGSALEYTVKPHPRFLPYAEEGDGGGRAASSSAPATRRESLWAALPEVPGLEEKTRLGPPGVDTSRSSAPPPASASRGGRSVVFVGKLIVSKGVDLLLAAWPLVARDTPRRGCGSPASASTRRAAPPAGGARARRLSTTPARSRASAGRSRAGRRSRCRSSRPSSPIRRPAIPRRPRGRRLGRARRPARARRGRGAAAPAPRRW